MVQSVGKWVGTNRPGPRCGRGWGARERPVPPLPAV